MAIAPEEIPVVQVRVNPQNASLMPDNPEYREVYDRDSAEIKAALMEQMRDAIAAGTFTLDIDSNNSSQAIEEEVIMFTAQNMTQREMTLRAALGGYGLVGISDGMYYHGVNIEWIPDEAVPLGDHQFEGVEDIRATSTHLRSLA